jgi:hypothetical protein
MAKSTLGRVVMDNLPPDWNDLEDNLDAFIRQVVGQRVRDEVEALLKQRGLDGLGQDLNDVRYAQQDMDKRVRALAQELDQLNRDTHQNVMALSSHINTVAAAKASAAEAPPQTYVPPPPSPRSSYSYEEQPRAGDPAWDARQAARMPANTKPAQGSFFSQWVQQLTKRSAFEWALVVVLVATLGTMAYFGWKMFIAHPANTVAAAGRNIDDATPDGSPQSGADNGLAKLLGEGLTWSPCPNGACSFAASWSKADAKEQDALMSRAEKDVIAQCKDVYNAPKAAPKGPPSWERAAQCGPNAPKLDARDHKQAAAWLLQQLASQP